MGVLLGMLPVRLPWLLIQFDFWLLGYEYHHIIHVNFELIYNDNRLDQDNRNKDIIYLIVYLYLLSKEQ